MNPLRVFIGYDDREALAYAVCVSSIERYSSRPFWPIPLSLKNMRGFYSEGHAGASNAFSFSRFLVPYLCNFSGPALYLDCDIIVRYDIAKLFALAEQGMDVMVVKHNYEPRHAVKYFGAPNPSYEKKNWSSVMLFPNCSNFPCQKLLPGKIQESSGKYLHRFEWTDEQRVGSLPIEWNWLAGEYEKRDDAKLYHYTNGTPFIHGYGDCDNAEFWWDEYHHLMANVELPNPVPRKALLY